VASIARLIRYSLLSCALGVGLSAQTSPWDGSFKIQMGYLDGNAAKVLNNKETLNTFGFAGEVTYRLDKSSVLAFDLGYRFFPGTANTMSYIPATLVANSTYTALVRKDEAKGFQASALYRRAAFTEGMSWQAGLRLGRYQVTETDTGSTVTTGATPAVTRIDTIATVTEKNTFNVGVLAGLHYQFTDQYSGELNAFTTGIESPTSGKKNGLVVELGFGIRF
jgi:hypothetical protein